MHRLLGLTTKQPLSKLEFQILENISNLENWGRTLFAKKKKNVYNIK